MIIKIKKFNEETRLPTRMTDYSAGYDIYACLSQDVVLAPSSFALISTGFSIALPIGYEAQVRPRSGLALHHQIGILNSPGTIDADYRGEVKVLLYNFGKSDFIVKNGMRIAQIIINKIENVEFIAVRELPETKRNDGGFGHTDNPCI